jgi:nitrogen fixation protein FixH
MFWLGFGILGETIWSVVVIFFGRVGIAVVLRLARAAYASFGHLFRRVYRRLRED